MLRLSLLAAACAALCHGAAARSAAFASGVRLARCGSAAAAATTTRTALRSSLDDGDDGGLLNPDVRDSITGGFEVRKSFAKIMADDFKKRRDQQEDDFLAIAGSMGVVEAPRAVGPAATQAIPGGATPMTDAEVETAFLAAEAEGARRKAEWEEDPDGTVERQKSRFDDVVSEGVNSNWKL